MTSWWIQFSLISEGADLEHLGLETERQRLDQQGHGQQGQGPQVQGQRLPCPE